MTDQLVPVRDKSTDLAYRFMEDHREQFAGAENNGGAFPLLRVKFDEWCVKVGTLSALPEDYETGSDLRTGLVQKRNYTRTMINNAAVYGKHGWPPYEIQIDGDEYSVLLIEPLLRTITYEVAERIEKLIGNKMSFLAKIGKDMATDERLPADLQQRWRENNRLFKTAARACEYHIRQYLEEFSDDYTVARDFLNRLPK